MIAGPSGRVFDYRLSLTKRVDLGLECIRREKQNVYSEIVRSGGLWGCVAHPHLSTSALFPRASDRTHVFAGGGGGGGGGKVLSLHQLNFA